ncbi:hypothetical protein QA645_17035 [Bradyrhizobium sp. CIAT3101]|uniref:hypothetical protein n=1 Tax=Bradyrhizobium sp. CIAT3101 TaxID=439387 RepID=UPI0024B0CF33|nr:hypothetical protein [Bradyrhizobium sp. CIAT3101]WFU84377.1 hypothetical protein QA645_17035 [Bradyrhizobium sp. CIAT3101]
MKPDVCTDILQAIQGSQSAAFFIGVMMTDYFNPRADLRANWDRVTGRVSDRPMHPVLANAIKNPRMPKPYGGGEGDYKANKTVRGVDTFVRLNRNGDKRTILAATS